MSRYPKNVKDSLIDEFRQGATYQFLIEKYGVSSRTIAYWTRGIERENVIPTETIIDMKYNRKMSNQAIATQLGMSLAAIGMRLNRYHKLKKKD